MPFPGAAFRQTVDLLIRQNLLLGGELPFDGGTARLRDIKRPFLNISCEQDTIVPAGVLSRAAAARSGRSGRRRP